MYYRQIWVGFYFGNIFRESVNEKLTVSWLADPHLFTTTGNVRPITDSQKILQT